MRLDRGVIVGALLAALAVIAWLAWPGDRPVSLGERVPAPEDAVPPPPAPLAASGREARSAAATGPRVPGAPAAVPDDAGRTSTRLQLPPALRGRPFEVDVAPLGQRVASSMDPRATVRSSAGPDVAGTPRGAGVQRMRVADDGTLSLPGGADDEFAVQPVELEWIVAVPRIAPGATVPVVPAFALSVRVVADADGAALATFEASATAQGAQRAFRATDGGFVVQWPRDGAERLDAVVTAVAPGFLPATRDVRIVASTPVERVELRLVRAPRPGAVEVTVIGAPAGLLERGFDVEFQEPAKLGTPVARREVPAPVGGVFRFELEEGAWRIRLRPRDASLAVVACAADVVVVSERTTELSWRVPPCGSIRFHWSPTSTFGRWVLRPEEGGTAASLDVPGEPLEHHHVPAGAYRMTFDGPGDGPSLSVIVKEGETTVVELK